MIGRAAAIPSSPADTPPTGRRILAVALASGFLGAFLGVASGWQIAVESAQAISGAVEYPAGNPFFMYHVKSWTLLHQAPAVLLHWGMSEQTVSLIIAGAIGAASFLALALCTLALCGRPVLAVCTPLVCLASSACSESSALYPVKLLSTDPWWTYGVAGTALVVLSWSLLGLGSRVAGGLLMGLTLAIHPALGAWGLLCGAIGQVWQWRSNRFAGMLPFAAALAAGLTVSGASLLMHLAMSRNVGNEMPAENARLVREFSAHWDSHRGAYPLDSPAPILAVVLAALIALILAKFAEEFSPAALLLLRVLAAAAIGGLVLVGLTLIQDRLPSLLVAAMPGRYINAIGLAFPAVLLGLAARFRSDPAARLLLPVVLLGLCLRTLATASEAFYAPPATDALAVGAVFLLVILLSRNPRRWRDCPVLRGSTHSLALRACTAVVAAAVCLHVDRPVAVLGLMVGAVWAGRGFSRRGLRHVPRSIGAWTEGSSLAAMAGVVLQPGMACVLAILAAGWTMRRHARALAWGLCGVATFAALALLLRQVRDSRAALQDWRNEPVFAKAAQGRGLLLTGSNLRLIQLRTRRGLVLSGFGLNQITYVPESAAGINRALMGIYGEDLAAPRPADWTRRGGLARESGRAIWEARSRAEWAILAVEFGFTEVMTYADWRLDLPLLAQSAEYRLHAVGPAAASAHVVGLDPTGFRLAVTADDHGRVHAQDERPDQAGQSQSVPDAVRLPRR